MNPGSGSAFSDATSQLPLPDASKVPSYVNLARCVSGYTSLTSYTSPARREYSPARRDFSPIGGRSRRDFSPAPSSLSGTARRDLSCSRLADSNKENPERFGTMYSGSPLSPQKYTAQGPPCEGNVSVDGGRSYLKLSMLDNLTNSPARTSRTTFRSPLHLPKSPPSSGSNGAPSVLDMNRLRNGSDSRSPATFECENGTSPYYATNGDLLNRNANVGGGSSPDAVDSDIRRRVEQLEKASCKNLSYTINRTSKSPKVDERNGGKQYPIRNRAIVSPARDDFSSGQKEIITLDAERDEKGSPIPVMKLLNPEFRAMLGKTTKISPSKQFTADFAPTGLSPLAKEQGKVDTVNNNGDRFAGTNGSKNINLKSILTAESGVNGVEKASTKVVNINVIVSKNVNQLIKHGHTLHNGRTRTDTNDAGIEEAVNCRNNNVQRHRELIENNINSSLNLSTSDVESNVARIRNDLVKSSPIASGESRENKDVLVKQINTSVSNVKENIEKSEIERGERMTLNISSLNSKESPLEVTPSHDTKDTSVAPANDSKDSVHSKEDRRSERQFSEDLVDIDDAFNGNLVETNQLKTDDKRAVCQTFIDIEQAFVSSTSVAPEELTSVKTASAPLDLTPELIDISDDTLPLDVVVINSSADVPQGTAPSPIPNSKTESYEQLIETEETCKPDATDSFSVSIATESPVKDGLYYKKLLGAQRVILAEYLSAFESVLSDHEASKSQSEELSCTDSVALTPSCDTNKQHGASVTGEVAPSNISSDLEGHILLTVGQCKLLLNKKFPFFEKNCDKSLKQAQQVRPPDATEELQILNEDLTGLWDTMCIQIDEVRDKFEGLSRLRDNNWAPLAGSDNLDAVGKSNAGSRPGLQKVKYLRAAGGSKRSSLGSAADRKTLGGAGSKSTSALPQLKAAKNEERKKFLEEKRKAMLAERRREMKQVEMKEGGDAEGGVLTDGLVQFL